MRPAAFAALIIQRLVKGRHLRMGLRVEVAEQEPHQRLCDTVIPVCNSEMKNKGFTKRNIGKGSEWWRETQVMNEDEGGHEAKERG